MIWTTFLPNCGTFYMEDYRAVVLFFLANAHKNDRWWWPSDFWPTMFITTSFANIHASWEYGYIEYVLTVHVVRQKFEQKYATGNVNLRSG